MLKISFDGLIMEFYPAMIVAEKVELVE